MIRRGIGVQSYVSAGGFDADAQAVITAIESTGVTLTATQKTACNTLVTDLKGYGIWSKMKAVYGFLGGTAGAHKWNWKNPADTDAAFRLVFSGGMTHSSNGVLFGGVNGYANTYLNTRTQTTFNNLHLSVYCRTDTSGAKAEMGNVDNISNYLPIIALQIKTIQNSVPNRFASLIYSYTASDIINTENTNSIGFYIASRTASNSYKGYKNGLQIGNIVTTNGQTNSPNFPIFIGGYNAAGTAQAYTDREHAFASIGDGLTDTEAANLYTAVQKYQTTLGRSVGTQTVSDADAQAFVNAAVIEDQVQATAINTLVTDLKGYGIWTKMKAIYPFVGGTSSSHKWNLRDPRDLDAAFRLVFSGGWTHSSTGALPNGTNGYADSYFNPISQSTSNSNAHLSIYTRTANSTGTSRCYMGVGSIAGAINFFTLGFFTGGTREVGNVSGNGSEYSPSNSLSAFAGLKNITVNGSRSARYFKNGVFQSNAVTQSGSFLNNNIYVGAANDNGSAGYFQNTQIAFASIGDGLTDTEAANLYTAVQNMQTTLNRNV